MSPIAAAFLRSTVLPAAVAGVALLFAGGRKEPLKARLQAFILALSFMAGGYLLIGRISFPPADVSESLSYGALLLALFVAVSPKDVGSRYGFRAVFVVLTGAVLLWHIRASLSGPIHMRNLLAFFCLALGVWSIVERGAREVTLPTLIVLPLIAASGTSLLLLFSASASMSQLVTVLCGLLGASLAIALVKPERMSSFGLLPFLSVFIVAFMAAGHFYLDINPWHMIYLCWPFLLLWIRPWIPLPRKVLIEAPGFAILAAAPLGYFLWTVYKASGPLY